MDEDVIIIYKLKKSCWNCITFLLSLWGTLTRKFLLEFMYEDN
jgi:hypothetical protein